MKAINYYIGIDPGVKGAISVVDSAGKICCCAQFPSKKELSKTGRKLTRLDLVELVSLFKFISASYHNETIAIEKQVAMPGQNSIGTFNTGVGYGIILAMIEVFFPTADVNIVNCKDWQSVMIMNRTYVESKLRRDRRKQLKKDSIKAAQELFPDFEFKKSSKSKIDSDGMTDSALIAYYCYLQNK